MPVNSTRELHYTVTGAISEATVEALSSADMKVKVEPDDATGINGKIVLVSGAEINDDSKVVIFVTNGERMLMRTLLFDKVGIPAVEETTKCVDATGGRIELAFPSDSDCEAEIPDEARSWVRVAPSSRALTPHSIVLDIAANTDRPRSTVVTVRSVFVPTQCIEYTVEQAVGSTQLLYTTTGPCLQLSSDAFDAAIVSHTFKNGVGTIIFDKPITFLPKNTFADNPTYPNRHCHSGRGYIYRDLCSLGLFLADKHQTSGKPYHHRNRYIRPVLFSHRHYYPGKRHSHQG